MESVKHVHVRHNLIAGLDQIVGAVLSRNFGQPEVAFRIDQPGIHRHPSHIDHFRIFWNLHSTSAAQGSDLATRNYKHAVLNRPMRNRKQLPTLESESFLLRNRSRGGKTKSK